ncbi:MAG: hypothetical protein J3K34DRAFT_460238 [Monoraphidium minutum]|nr:MAG: hypothetical protein J3K34DRAFT_460238 [Monoraphidium minutum]
MALLNCAAAAAAADVGAKRSGTAVGPTLVPVALEEPCLIPERLFRYRGPGWTRVGLAGAGAGFESTFTDETAPCLRQKCILRGLYVAAAAPGRRSKDPVEAQSASRCHTTREAGCRRSQSAAGRRAPLKAPRRPCSSRSRSSSNSSSRSRRRSTAPPGTSRTLTSHCGTTCRGGCSRRRSSPAAPSSSPPRW